MKVQGKPYRSIWLAEDALGVHIIDQTRLPHEFVTRRLESLDDAVRAISAMQVRGAPLIGATAAYGMSLGMRADATDSGLDKAYSSLIAARPTAVNLRWALDEMKMLLAPLEPTARTGAAYRRAAEICDEDVEICSAIGGHGLALIQEAWKKKGANEPLNILTHCNAGWLAAVDWGTAMAPIYKAHDAGIPQHVWVSETRPRNQGASLTCWELGSHGVAHTLIVDNAAGHLLQQGQVDLCITGTDRTTASGDVCNKVGTYLKALAAHDNGVAFYVALPGPTIDWTIGDGACDIPIEERAAAEVTRMAGRTADGDIAAVEIASEGCVAANPAFDVTPAHLITGLITERGICQASAEGLRGLFPEP
ncbi:MAG TPA: S-methyl-5-thioribose-1-phosphate isomerase [Rhodospirillales bacterium]|jgi:methylthioribose-1-phosphate isomerase|nr:S-methyl-5-thioribose-1-phosphate isomerase [Rhodospirillales bacterium]